MTTTSQSASSAATPGAIAKTIFHDNQRAVVLELTINKSGHVRKAKPLSGQSALIRPAIQAAKKRRFERNLAYYSPATPHLEVEVLFAAATDEVTDVKSIMLAGVPGCIKAPEAVRISRDVMKTRLVRHVDPIYPSESQGQCIEGPVILRIHIDKDGNVVQAEQIGGAAALGPAMINTVMQWKYQPTLINGAPIGVETTVQIDCKP